MKLYHGSRHDGEKIESRQAAKGEGMKGIPEKELQEGIYLSPDYGFAMAMGARVPGETKVGDEDKTIKFEHPELFDPNSDIFMYTFDSDKINADNLEYIDRLQYIVKGLKELIPIEKESVKARELLKYYKLVNWKENNEIIPEQKLNFK